MTQIVDGRATATPHHTFGGESPSIALGHDYLTQRGGAERVVEVMARAFPTAPVYTTLFDAAGTFPSIAALDIRPSPLNKVGLLRRRHRLALPVLRPVVDRTQVDAELLLASSSGWAHGISCTGRKIVYCHAPARWLYQGDRYLGGREVGPSQRARRAVASMALAALGGGLREWDRRAALSADRYLVNSTVVQRAVRTTYGIEAEVVPPPPALMPAGDSETVPGIGRPFLLCVARLLPYKNVDVAIEGVRRAGGYDLVVVGDGPERSRLEALAKGDPRIHLLGRVSDGALRWLYANCDALVATSYEDYGLSPLEAAAAGRPTLALRDGGYLDTVAEGTTGLFFDRPDAASLAAAVEVLPTWEWDRERIRKHADSFGEERFVTRLREIVAAELA